MRLRYNMTSSKKSSSNLLLHFTLAYLSQHLPLLPYSPYIYFLISPARLLTPQKKDIDLIYYIFDAWINDIRNVSILDINLLTVHQESGDTRILVYFSFPLVASG